MSFDKPREVTHLKLFTDVWAKNYTYVIARIYETGCDKCKATEPTFKELATKHTDNYLIFVQMDIKAHAGIASKYVNMLNHHATTPFVVFRSGKEKVNEEGEVLRYVRDETQELKRVIERIVKIKDEVKKEWEETGVDRFADDFA
jgi:thiol-disulfide isomerase/thioredoxin